MRDRLRERGTGAAIGRRGEPASGGAARSGALGGDNRRDRLQPYLLDRLTDDEPAAGVEPGAGRTATLGELRQRLLRDLDWLLNTRLCEEVESSLTGRELASASVLRYGVPDMSGKSVQSMRGATAARRMETAIRDAIKNYEPRIVSSTLRVRVLSDADDSAAAPPMAERGLSAHHIAAGGQVIIEISGEMFCQPANQPLLVRTHVDLESGECRVGD